jgi:NACHT N-terminal Helical domain 7
VARGLCYGDAVTLLAGHGNKTVGALDRLMGGLLLAASATGSGFALSLFDGKGELARLSGELVAGLNVRLRGLGRFGRSERLAAAHAVIVLEAYFEVLAKVDLPVEAKKLDLAKAEQVAIAGSGAAGSNRLGALASELLRIDIPIHTSERPYEVTLGLLHGFYGHLSRKVLQFVSDQAGPVEWGAVGDTRRRRFTELLKGELPVRAVGRYEELFRRLAMDCPEMAFWANQVDHQATREEMRCLSAGLAGLEKVLTELAFGAEPDTRREALARSYQAALGRPILSSGDTPQGLRIPSLAAGYVNPDFRVVAVESSERLAEESWWEGVPPRNDLQEFLLGHLTAPQATEVPLLILGQPGSGKSVLTRILAARLPPREFLTVRVALREVPADTDLQNQLEYAIRATTGEVVRWPDLARSANGALPVILLDGFDELLQATGVSQADYLEKVTAFQAREVDQGRPAVVVVTSRTAVADRARCTPGTVVIRLEPFRDSHIMNWLAVWNEVNEHCLAARGMRPLSPAAVLAHPELASQPLLLMMLALYDFDSNALQQEDSELGHVGLYERLLTRFAQREVGKTSAALPDPTFAREVEHELLRLSVVAFAMFNRRRQWVTEAELNADLPALLGGPADRRTRDGLRSELAAADVVLGRFFFVHEGQATRDGVRLRTYEFLHATFGEYLIARLVARELADLAEVVDLNANRSRPALIDDAFLHALLSFAPLTMRGTTVSFLRELLRALPERHREVLHEVLMTLFQAVFDPRFGATYTSYEPTRLTVPARHAVYSGNLVFLALLTGKEVTAHELFPDATDDFSIEWRRLTLFWRSQFPVEGWDGVLATISIDRVWIGEQPDVLIRLSEDSPPEWSIDPYWSTHYAGSTMRRGFRGMWTRHSLSDLRGHTHLICERRVDALSHALEPLADELGEAIVTFYGFEEGRAVSPANALLRLWLASGSESNSTDLMSAYSTCVEMAIRGFGRSLATRNIFRTLVIHQLDVDRNRLPSDWLRQVVERMRETVKGDSFLSQKVTQIVPRPSSTQGDEGG